MILFPAVDIKGGRLCASGAGVPTTPRSFPTIRVAAALQWQEQGAKFLHLVDLDGAFEVCRRIRIWSARICEALSIPVQLGGGIRDEETAIAGLMRVWPV